MKIVFSSNVSWSVYNFRRGLLSSLQEDGHDIYTVASEDGYSDKLKDLGFNYYKVNINNNSKNPLQDLKTLYQYYKIYKQIKPDVICHNAIKPNIYGTLAAKILGIRVINNISGLGTLFIRQSFSTKIAKILYKISQNKASRVFFQNNDDLNLFLKNGLVKEEITKVIPGSGVNTNKFIPNKKKERKGIFIFLFVGRLIYDKGIRELIEACKILKRRYSNFKVMLLGPIYKSNETAINYYELKLWIEQGLVEYIGESDNVISEMQKADCLVLPSYREGLSKVLIEASSVGLPIITTNTPGCKDVVIDHKTGYLVEVKNEKDLFLKMEKMLLLSEKQRDNMGAEARKRAIAVFDEKIIIQHYKDEIYSLF
ncbi:glycosyltransferase family 4 protein [Tenacibaculum sp. UWU-22]|uniref:glycosyltransferase family 4 protein n=1 Tax=Tenacibaculum sp. UWU-22 TaxID=3234187 RepID=UPI0034DB32E1